MADEFKQGRVPWNNIHRPGNEEAAAAYHARREAIEAADRAWLAGQEPHDS